MLTIAKTEMIDILEAADNLEVSTLMFFVISCTYGQNQEYVPGI
jgi:hypothetical protein